MARALGPRHHPVDEVVCWRVERLRAAGFDKPTSQRLARDRRYDLHALLELVDRGATPALAARILAPLDDEELPQ